MDQAPLYSLEKSYPLAFCRIEPMYISRVLCPRGGNPGNQDTKNYPAVSAERVSPTIKIIQTTYYGRGGNSSIRCPVIALDPHQRHERYPAKFKISSCLWTEKILGTEAASGGRRDKPDGIGCPDRRRRLRSGLATIAPRHQPTRQLCWPVAALHRLRHRAELRVSLALTNPASETALTR